MLMAAQYGNAACMEWLFSHGAEKDVRTPNTIGDTPLINTCMVGHLEMAGQARTE